MRGIELPSETETACSAAREIGRFNESSNEFACQGTRKVEKNLFPSEGQGGAGVATKLRGLPATRRLQFPRGAANYCKHYELHKYQRLRVSRNSGKYVSRKRFLNTPSH
jgi:hypothetical protein